MPQAVLTLTATVTGDMAPTPATPDDQHHTLVNDAYPPGDVGTFVQTTGHVLGLYDEYALSEGPPTAFWITNINLKMQVWGNAISNDPALRAEIRANDVLIGSREFSVNTLSNWVETAINIPVDISGNAWRGGSRTVRFVPIDGNAGYGPVYTDVPPD